MGNAGDILPEAIGLPLLAVQGDEAYFFPTKGLKVPHAAETSGQEKKTFSQEMNVIFRGTPLPP